MKQVSKSIVGWITVCCQSLWGLTQWEPIKYCSPTHYIPHIITLKTDFRSCIVSITTWKMKYVWHIRPSVAGQHTVLPGPIHRKSRSSRSSSQLPQSNHWGSLLQTHNYHKTWDHRHTSTYCNLVFFIWESQQMQHTDLMTAQKCRAAPLRQSTNKHLKIKRLSHMKI